MKYRNTKTGAESNTFSERDWASGTPQRKGWIKVGEDKPVKTLPKDLVDFVFKKKPVEQNDFTIKTETLEAFEKEVNSVYQPVIGETKADFKPLPEIKQETIAVAKVSIPKKLASGL